MIQRLRRAEGKRPPYDGYMTRDGVMPATGRGLAKDYGAQLTCYVVRRTQCLTRRRCAWGRHKPPHLCRAAGRWCGLQEERLQIRWFRDNITKKKIDTSITWMRRF